MTSIPSSTEAQTNINADAFSCEKEHRLLDADSDKPIFPISQSDSLRVPNSSERLKEIGIPAIQSNSHELKTYILGDHCQETVQKLSYTFGYQQLRYFPEDSFPKEYFRHWVLSSNLEKFELNRSSGESSIAISGLGMSGTPHIGTLAQIYKLKYLKEEGVKIQLILGDSDALGSRAISTSEVRKISDKFTRFCLSLGFLDVEDIKIQSGDKAALELSRDIVTISNDEDFNLAREDLEEFYISNGKHAGMTDSHKSSIALMAADFILPALKNSPIKNILILSGTDEHMYFKYAEVIKNKLGVDTCFSTALSPLIQGINGHEKMSKSFDKSSINLDLEEDDILNRIRDLSKGANPKESKLFKILCSASNFTANELEAMPNNTLDRKQRDKWSEVVMEYSDFIVDLKNKWENS